MPYMGSRMGPSHDEEGNQYFRVGIVGAHYPTNEQSWDAVRFVVGLPPATHVYVYGYHGVDRDVSLAAIDVGMSVWRLIPRDILSPRKDTLYHFIDLDELHCWLAPPSADLDHACNEVRRMIAEGVPWVQH